MPKTSSTPFTYYSFRYDYPDDITRDKILSFIKRECMKYAIFDEVSTEVGKKHIQGKIGKAISDVQLRKHFKEAFPKMLVKSNYSLGIIKDAEKYDSYICKDGKALINNIFTSEYIDQQVEKHNQIINEIKVKDIKKSKTFTEDVAIEFTEKYPNLCSLIISEYGEYKPDKSKTEDAKKMLLGFLLKRLGKIAKVFDNNVLQRMYNGLKNYIIMNASDEYPSGYIQSFEHKIEL